MEYLERLIFGKEGVVGNDKLRTTLQYKLVIFFAKVKIDMTLETKLDVLFLCSDHGRGPSSEATPHAHIELMSNLVQYVHGTKILLILLQVCTPSSNKNIIELQGAQDDIYKTIPEISD